VPGSSEGANWLWRVTPRSAEAYAFALCCVVIASLVRWWLGHIDENIVPFATYFPAVLFASLIGGVGAGIFAAVFGGIIGWWAFMPPPFRFVFQPGQEISLVAYFLSSLFIVWGADHYRKVTKRLEDEEKFRKLAVDELAHRLKNKIATIQSIISYQLRDDPKTRDAIFGRLIALSGTDDLIMEAQGQGARLRQILSAELGPYETSRIAIEGPAIILSPKLAMTMALLVHELATNAAKYGALSSVGGRLTISWSLSGNRLSLEWCERDGPSIVSAPVHRGFGMRLLSQALDQFGGQVETTFETTGLICKLSMTLPEDSIVPDETPKAA
jgi:two-component sensor histidine kinase